MPVAKFLVYDPDTMDEDDAKEIEEWAEDDAAVEYAKWYDMRSGDPYQDERLLLVKKVGADVWVRITVTAEPDIHYSAVFEDE